MARLTARWLIGMAVLVAVSAADADELTVWTGPVDGMPPGELVHFYLKARAHAALQHRRDKLDEVKSPDEQAVWQQRLRREFVAHLGGFPERTPLNARTVGRLAGDGYHIEKVIYESQPGLFVTASLYLPEKQPPLPGVVIASGHSREGKAAGYNQLAAIALARHGIAAVCYDPIGQGERSQFLDTAGKPRFATTVEHTLLGAACIPLGRNTATFRVWDGIRSIDYLAERPEIDPERIGFTGCSGGGTLTSYCMALDERIACAAPSCYLTNFDRLIDTIGPQDAEQNIHGQIAWGMDHADYVLMRAPRPTLMLVATHDFFDIRGAWDTFREAKRFYTRLGMAERIDLAENDAKHGFPLEQREPMVRWMQRWLVGVDGATALEPAAPLPESQLLCTPRGQALLLDGAESAVTLNVALDDKLADKRKALWSGDRGKALAEVRRISGIRPADSLSELKATSVGVLRREGYRIEKLVLDPGDAPKMPALLLRPDKPAGAPVLYLHDKGKAAEAGPGGALEKLVRQGRLVLAVDLAGIGELASEKRAAAGSTNMWGGDWKPIFLAYLLGKSMLSIRAEETVQCARLLGSLAGGAPAEKMEKVDLIAVGLTVPPALHAAALERGLFHHVTLVGPIESWSSLVRDPTMPGQLVNVVHGALTAYDLPDLAASLPDEMLTRVDTKPSE